MLLNCQINKHPLPLWVTIDKETPDNSLENFLCEVNPFGLILFARHLKNKNQVKNLISFVKKLRQNILIGVDQEGGKVSRLEALGYKFDGAKECNENPDKVRKLSCEMAEVLRELGFDVNFAPVVDVGKVEEKTGLNGRIYSEDKQKVIECAEAFLEGLKLFGMKGCLKHFPGLGGSLVDSHKDLPIISGNLEEREEHLLPYKKLKADFVMVAHAKYQMFSSPLPSSINKEAYSLLREIGCCDTIVTDDLTMGALKTFGNLSCLTKMSLRSGADIAMVICSEKDTLEIAKNLSGV